MQTSITLDDTYQDGAPFADIPQLSPTLALETFTDAFQHSDSLDALMKGLGCGEANAVIDLLRSLGQDHMAEVALTTHAARDDEGIDSHYLTDYGFGRYVDEDAPRCEECDTWRDAELVHGKVLCPSCLHDAERSGWTGDEAKGA